jgi:hypothetical protein
VIEGDGAGYDVASFELDDAARSIEVKTTRGESDTDFFISANEVEFPKRHAASYYLYRVFNFEPESSQGTYYVWRGSLIQQIGLPLEAVQFRARLSTNQSRSGPIQ